MRYVVIILNIVGLAFATFTLVGRFLHPTPMDIAVLGTALTFLPFTVALFARQKPRNIALRRTTIVANILGGIVGLAGIFVVLRSGIANGPKIALLFTLAWFVPCLTNVLFFARFGKNEREAP
jgi:hypothetical protein